LAWRPFRIRTHGPLRIGCPPDACWRVEATDRRRPPLAEREWPPLGAALLDPGAVNPQDRGDHDAAEVEPARAAGGRSARRAQPRAQLQGLAERPPDLRLRREVRGKYRIVSHTALHTNLHIIREYKTLRRRRGEPEAGCTSGRCHHYAAPRCAARELLRVGDRRPPRGMAARRPSYDAFGVFGANFRELEWKRQSLFSWREVRKTPNAS
jgi:hypothetical protein